MRKYLIVRINYSFGLFNEDNIDNLELEIVQQFLGPFIKDQPNLGLYAGDDLDLFAFYF